MPGINISTSTIITTTFIYKYILEKKGDKKTIKMKEQCPIFDIECVYISTCYKIREERCLESMRKVGLEDIPSDEDTSEEISVWMTNLLREKRLKSEKKKINIFKRKKNESNCFS